MGDGLMRTLPVILVSLLGADFQMLSPPLHDAPSFQMLAAPRDPPADDEVDDRATTRTIKGASDVSVAARSRRLLAYLAPGCPPCQVFRDDVIPKLRRAGWEIGTEPTNHVQLIESDSDLPGSIVFFPTFELIEKGRVVRRHEGFLDAWGVGELVKGVQERPNPIPIPEQEWRRK